MHSHTVIKTQTELADCESLAELISRKGSLWGKKTSEKGTKKIKTHKKDTGPREVPIVCLEQHITYPALNPYQRSLPDLFKQTINHVLCGRVLKLRKVE